MSNIIRIIRMLANLGHFRELILFAHVQQVRFPKRFLVNALRKGSLHAHCPLKSELAQQHVVETMSTLPVSEYLFLEVLQALSALDWSGGVEHMISPQHPNASALCTAAVREALEDLKRNDNSLLLWSCMSILDRVSDNDLLERVLRLGLDENDCKLAIGAAKAIGRNLTAEEQQPLLVHCLSVGDFEAALQVAREAGRRELTSAELEQLVQALVDMGAVDAIQPKVVDLLKKLGRPYSERELGKIREHWGIAHKAHFGSLPK